MIQFRCVNLCRGALLVLHLVACSDSPTGETRPIPPAGNRSTFDRPAEVSGRQVHLIYLIPADGVDRGSDTTGTLDGSVAAFQSWLAALTGKSLRLDTWQGRLDISFLKSRRTDSQIAAMGEGVLRTLYLEILDTGFDAEDTKYLIYYDGTHSTCGSATQDGPVAALYLRGVTATRSCNASFATPVAGRPGYWEFAALHEIAHMLGAVDARARHHDADDPWHVRDGEDLMNGSGAAWVPMYFDRGNDDYYGAGVPAAVRNLANDPILVPVRPSPARAPSVRIPAGALPAFEHQVLRFEP